MEITSRHLVDPELSLTADKLPNRRFNADSLEDVRREIEDFYGVAVAGPTIITEQITIPASHDRPEVAVLLYRPTRAAEGPRAVLLFFHSGGFVCGSAGMMEITHRKLALELDAIIIAPEYRLAPEHPYPAALFDCYATLEWVAAEAEGLGVDAGRIAVCGSSAGSALAAAVALKSRDEGGPRVSFQYLINPMLDDRTCISSDPHPYTGQFVLTPDDNHFFWSSLLGQAPGSPGVPEYAAPSRAENLAGLPPAYLSVGALDLFVEETLEYARRLIRAGVSTELHVFPGAFHGSAAMAPDAAISRAADRCGLDALRRALSLPSVCQEP